MQDPREKQLAELLTRHSMRVRPGDRVLIEASSTPESMVVALIEAVTAAGGLAAVDLKEAPVMRALMSCGTAEQVEARMRLLGQIELERMEKMEAYVALRGSLNVSELADVPPDKMRLYEQHWLKPVHLERRVRHTRWVVLRWPTPSMAQMAGMSTQAFEDFYFKVCLADYEAMEQAVKPLQELMSRTDRVRITGPGTDLRFSIKGVGVVSCYGRRNIPDGECFTAPVKDSVEGHIQFNAPTIYRGVPFDDVRLVFRQGRVVEARANNTAALEAILDVDEGARYVGEFAIAFNPYIDRPMRDILFDEKIRGSLHLALGQCYEETENTNRSAIHWDLVLLQEQGGELWFDDVLIRRDGRFVVPELAGLNPENLGGRRPALTGTASP